MKTSSTKAASLTAPVLLDFQAEDVRPVVVARWIKALPFLEEARRLEVRVEDPLLVVEWPGEVRAVGPEDRTASPAEDVLPLESVSERKIVRVGRGPLEMAGRHHERAGLPGDVDEGRLPRVSVVGRRGDVDLDPRLVQREPRQRHVVLPADQATEAADARLDRPQPAAVARAPDQALVVGRHEFPVLEDEAPVWPVVQERVVDRAGALGVDLRDARDEPHAVRLRSLTETVGSRAWHCHGLLRDAGEGRLRALVGPTGEVLRPGRGRIDRDEGLGEDDELGALAGGLGGQPLELLQRRVAVENDRLGLHASGFDRALHATDSRERRFLADTNGQAAGSEA